MPETFVPEQMTEAEIARAMGGDVVKTPSLFQDGELADIETFDQLVSLMGDKGIQIDMADKVLGDGFAILNSEDKGTLVGKTMILIDWRFSNGDMGEFVSIRAAVQMTPGSQDLRKLIINDGSAGIFRDLKKFSAATGKYAGLMVKRGLRVSEYDYEWTDKDGVVRRSPAKTFYLDTSAVG